MKDVYFISPNPVRLHPRGIRIDNIIKNLMIIAPDRSYKILSFSNHIKPQNDGVVKQNMFNLIYLLIRYSRFLKYGRSFSNLAKKLDPFVFLHALIKIDICFRIKKKKESDLTFVVVVSPFSNYLLVPWLRERYPNAKIICDIGDPLFKNSARWNNDSNSRDIECNALRCADFIILTNSETSVHFQNEYKFNKNNISIIEQGVDIGLIEIAEQKIKKRIKDSLCYAGSFYPNLRSPEALFKYISNQNKFNLYLFGTHNLKGMKNVICKGIFHQEQLFKEIQKIEIIVYIDNKYGIQTSGKIFEVLSFKKPILFIKGKENSFPYQIAQKHPNVFFADNNSNSITDALARIKNAELITYLNTEIFGWKYKAIKYNEII